MPITLTSTDAIVSSGFSTTATQTLTTTLTITPNPLTTAFEPPPYCTQSFLSNCQTDIRSGIVPCYISLYPEGVCDSDGQSCYPAVPGELGNTYLYSPGIACPSAWTTAWQEVRTPSGADEETTAHCCPSGLSITTYGIYSTWCEGTQSQGEPTIVINGLSECPSSTTAFSFGPSSPVDLKWVNVNLMTDSASGIAVFTLSAEQVALLYRSSDLVTTGAWATSTAVVGTGWAASSGGATAASTSSAGTSVSAGGGAGRQSSTLSTGAMAGIAIGAAALGIAAVLGTLYLCLRYGRGEIARRWVLRFRVKGGHLGQRPPIGAMSENPAPQRPTTIVHSISPVLLPGSSCVEPQAPPVMELQGSLFPGPARSESWPHSSEESSNQRTPSRGELPGINEASALTRDSLGFLHEASGTGHDYHQLPATPVRAFAGNSLQTTPIDLIACDQKF